MILGQEDLELTRFAAGTRGADGRFVAAGQPAVPFSGSVQPAPGRVLETLEEGERKRGVWLLFTRTELRTADLDAQTPADRVIRVVDGREYEVREVHHWPKLLTHYEVVLVGLKEAG